MARVEFGVCPTRLTAERAKPFTSIGLSLIFMVGGESSQKPLKSPVCNILPRIPVRQVGHTLNLLGFALMEVRHLLREWVRLF